MAQPPHLAEPEACAGGIVLDAAGRLLVVLRGRPPGAGLWSVPGGRVEPGETAEQACVREVAEETGLVVEIVRFAGRVSLPGADLELSAGYVVDDFVCRPVGGQLQAGDDAAQTRWVTAEEFEQMPRTPGLAGTLRAWQVFPTS
jgi:ADP-ribose pyrophosphatase YjhB (NUDIX family)